ncbi:MAG: aminodeoxychorismate/anthranilate synthase component II [Alphaproteobacteria bacterium]|nr:aminodeoxychorismate/anthranilate synthase component II [Alphaproteobacteria bacterium]
MLLLIDNYDSFTWNLVQYLGDLGSEVEVKRNDALTVAQALALHPKAIVISPGPCDPDKAGICLPLIKAAAGKIPLLGVCLGHQAIGQAFGGQVVRAPKPMHGKMDLIHHTQKGLFQGIPTPFKATRYHSLIVERTTLPDCLDTTGESADGLIMAMAHKTLPVFGVQFHPESIASEHGHDLLANFLTLSGIPVQKKAA